MDETPIIGTGWLTGPAQGRPLHRFRVYATLAGTAPSCRGWSCAGPAAFSNSPIGSAAFQQQRNERDDRRRDDHDIDGNARYYDIQRAVAGFVRLCPDSWRHLRAIMLPTNRPPHPKGVPPMTATAAPATAAQLNLADPNLSYVHGASDVPLIGATIGDLFDRVAAAVAGAARRSSPPSGRALHAIAQLQAQCDRFARGLLALGISKGDRVGIWAPNHAEWVVAQFATPKIGAILVNINPAYRTHELEYALTQSGCAALIIAPPFKTSDYAALLHEVCPELDDCAPGELRAASAARAAHGDRLRRAAACRARSTGTMCWRAPTTVSRRRAGRAPARAGVRRRDQHPVHLRHDRLPEGRDALAPLDPQQRLLHRRVACASPTQDRLCIPVPFYHCFGMVLGNLGCVTHGATMVIPAPGLRPAARRWRRSRRSAAPRCTACRRCSSPSWTHPEFARFDLSTLRTGIMAGSPCPIEVMKQVNEQDAHGRGDDRLRHDRDLAASRSRAPPTTRSSKRVSTVGRVQPHVECKIVDPGDRRGRAARRSRASCSRAATS